MKAQRSYLRINVGNLLEMGGAGAASYGVYRLAGLGICLIVVAAFLVVGAELVYDGHAWSIPLPRVRLGAIAKRFRRR